MSSHHHSYGDQNRLFWKPTTIIRTSLARRFLTSNGGNPYLDGNLITSSTISTVEAEMHDIPQHHLQVRLPILRPR